MEIFVDKTRILWAWLMDWQAAAGEREMPQMAGVVAIVCLLAATLATVHVGRAAVDRNLTWTVDGIKNYTT